MICKNKCYICTTSSVTRPLRELKSPELIKVETVATALNIKIAFENVEIPLMVMLAIVSFKN